MMLLYLWPMQLLLIGWIIVTHFSGVSLSSIFINYSISKKVQLESYQIPVDMLAKLLCLRHCIGFLLNLAQSLKQPPLFASFFTLVFPSLLLHISLPDSSSYSTKHSQSGGNFLVVPKFQRSIHTSIK